MSFEVINLKEAKLKKSRDLAKTLGSFNAQWTYKPPVRPTTHEIRFDSKQLTSPRSKQSKRSHSQIPTAYQNNKGILIPRDIYSSQTDYNTITRTPVESRRSARPLTDCGLYNNFSQQKKRQTLLNLISSSPEQNLPIISKKKVPVFKRMLPYRPDLNRLIEETDIKISTEALLENISSISHGNSNKNTNPTEGFLKENGSLLRRKIKEKDIEIVKPKYKITDLPARGKEFQNSHKSKSAGLLLDKFIKNQSSCHQLIEDDLALSKASKAPVKNAKSQIEKPDKQLSAKFKIVLKRKLDEGKFFEKSAANESEGDERRKTENGTYTEDNGLRFSLKLNENKRVSIFNNKREDSPENPTIEDFQTLENTNSEADQQETKPDAGTPTVANFEKRITLLLDGYKKTPFFNTNYIGPEPKRNEGEAYKMRDSVNFVVDANKHENRFNKHFPSFKLRLSEIYSSKQMRDIRFEFKRQKRSKAEILKSIKDTLKYINSLKLTLEEIRKKNVFSFKPFQKPFSYQFIQSVKIGDYATMITLLASNKYLVYDYDYVYMTALHWAAKRNEYEIAEKLISYGADVNAKDIIGRTPLFFAVKHHHIEMMQLLLWNQANPWSTKDMNLNEICATSPNAMLILKKARKTHIVMKMTPAQFKKQTWERQAQEIMIDPTTGEHIDKRRKARE